MATLQTGTAPNQIPTNGDLGDLAFQSKESVQFTGGRGALSSINLNQIYKEIAVTAVDVFVYDTSKDSDGGAWRRRTQHTSWYNEILNTATRGSRREFPSVAVIVATTTSVTIYDGDDPAMPMWMVFTIDNSYWLKHTSATTIAVSAINGVLVTGGSGATGRLSVIEFIADRGYVSESAYNYKHTNISRRNTDPVGAAIGSIFIVNNSVNDVAVTVLPNAPIDAATGLPIPTIAVATAGGVSVIKHDGTVITIQSGNNTYAVHFAPNNDLLVSVNNVSSTFAQEVYANYQNTISAVSTRRYFFSAYGSSSALALNLRVQEGQAQHVKYMNNNTIAIPLSNDIFGSSAGGLQLVAENVNDPDRGMTCMLNTSFSSGWMVGAIKGAWLSSASSGSITAPTNLITNGTFTSNVTGWAGTGLTWDSANGRAQITNTTLYGGINQTFSVVKGKSYYYAALVTCSVAGQNIRIQIAGIGLLNPTQGELNTATTATIYGWFHANVNGSITLQIIPYGGNYASTFYVDNVVVYELEADRSINGRGLQTFGSITKTPVATGADLVAYSGFTDNDYLLQPYNSSIDLSTNFTISGWYRTTDTAGVYRGLFYKNTQGSLGDGIQILMNPSNQVYGYVYGTPDDATVADTIATNDGNWHNVVFTRSGNLITLYIDGNSKGTSSANMGTLTNTNSVTSIGVYSASNSGYYWRGSLALWRVSSTAASAEQIVKMYNDEKYLFQDGAKATLYGSSDSVTALAYDEDTQLLHAGTSSGRSVFRGLRRVDNTTTAVGAAISAANGLVAED
jgi:hypothetical protein